MQPPPMSSASTAQAGTVTAHFIKRKELIFKRNHANTAIILGDIDGDNHQELVVGSLDGTLAIFKGLEKQKPWAQGTDFGMIMTLAMGRIWSWLDGPQQQQQQLVAITVDGDVHVFQAPPSSSSAGPSSNGDEPWGLSPIVTEGVEANVTTALIADIDDDGECELVLGCSDGEILVYGWHMGLGDEGRPQMFEKTGGKVSSAVMSLSVIGDGSAQRPMCLVAGLETGTIEILDCRERNHDGFIGQRRSRTSSLIRHDYNLAGLDGKVRGGDEEASRGGNDDEDDGEERLHLVELGVGGGLPLPQCGWCGPLVCCRTDSGPSSSSSSSFAVAGLDGRLAVGAVSSLKSENDETVVAGAEEDLSWKTTWSKWTSFPFFAIAPFGPLLLSSSSSSSDTPANDEAATAKVTGGGFAACGWSGFTYIVNPSMTDVIITFDASSMIIPPLRGFVAGKFGQNDEPCLFYSCADGRIHLFHDLQSQLSADKAGSALLQLRSKELRGLIKAWVDLYLGGPSSSSFSSSSTKGIPTAGGGGGGGAGGESNNVNNLPT